MDLGRTRLACGLVMLLLLTGLGAERAPAATLVGRAVLPADTFSVGPTSGQFITAATTACPRSCAGSRFRAFRPCSVRKTEMFW